MFTAPEIVESLCDDYGLHGILQTLDYFVDRLARDSVSVLTSKAEKEQLKFLAIKLTDVINEFNEKWGK